jgi:hypothetical protein
MLEAVAERLTFISDLSLFHYYFQAPDYQHVDSQKDGEKLFGR